MLITLIATLILSGCVIYQTPGTGPGPRPYPVPGIEDEQDEGFGYHYEKHYDLTKRRHHQHVESSCFWMENRSGTSQWIPAETVYGRELLKSDCYALDSCGGGLGQSGGGCYKWSAGPDAPSEAW